MASSFAMSPETRELLTQYPVPDTWHRHDPRRRQRWAWRLDQLGLDHDEFEKHQALLISNGNVRNARQMLNTFDTVGFLDYVTLLKTYRDFLPDFALLQVDEDPNDRDEAASASAGYEAPPAGALPKNPEVVTPEVCGVEVVSDF